MRRFGGMDEDSAGVPVDESVAANLRAICPDLPMPVAYYTAAQSAMHRRRSA
jgi:hypothetical protein